MPERKTYRGLRAVIAAGALALAGIIESPRESLAQTPTPNPTPIETSAKRPPTLSPQVIRISGGILFTYVLVSGILISGGLFTKTHKNK